MKKMMGNWSELPEEIIDLVAKRLPPYPNEFVQFSLVCKSWNSVVKKIERNNIICCAPWLMLAKSKNDKQSKRGAIRSFYCHSTKRAFNYYLPQAQGTRCWGTPYGWLVTFGLDRNIHLLHPLSRIQISLPPQPTFEHQCCHLRTPKKLSQLFLTKFAVASNPSTVESGQRPLVMAIYGEICHLAIASPGDEAWTSVECNESNYEDIIFYNGHFYGVTTTGILRKICEVNTPRPKAIDFASRPEDVNFCSRFYLVELSGGLYMVERYFKNKKKAPTYILHYETKYFVVYKFDFYSKTWTEVEDLGDHALFLGNNNSFSITTSAYPEFKRNCIYFTDDHSDCYDEAFCDMGIYDIENDSIEPFYFDDHQLSKFSRAVFFMPTL